MENESNGRFCQLRPAHREVGLWILFFRLICYCFLTIFRLLWHQIEFRLVQNLSENCNYNTDMAQFKLSTLKNWFLCLLLNVLTQRDRSQFYFRLKKNQPEFCLGSKQKRNWKPNHIPCNLTTSRNACFKVMRYLIYLLVLLSTSLNPNILIISYGWNFNYF